MRDQEFTEFLFRCQILGHLPSDRLADAARFLIGLADEDPDSMKSWFPVVIRLSGSRRQDAVKIFRMLMLEGNDTLKDFIYSCDPSLMEVIKKIGSWGPLVAAERLKGINSFEDIQSLDLEDMT